MEIFREDIIYGQEENIVKKIVSLLETAALFFMAFPMTAWAAEGSAESISPAFCIPFAGLLLCVAVLPLIKAEWWESHQLHAVIFWSLLFIVPFAVFWGAGEAAEKVLECIIDDYLTFYVLLFGLFCVSGNITLGRGPSRFPKDQCGTSGTRNPVIQLDRNHRSQYVNDPSDHQDERVEKEKTPHRDLLYLYGVQYGRLPDSDRRSASAHGIHAGCPVFLELKAFTDPDLQYDHPAVHLLSF